MAENNLIMSWLRMLPEKRFGTKKLNAGETLNSSLEPIEEAHIQEAPKLGSYRYNLLKHADSIRLIYLHPGERSSQIQISLREVRSSYEPEYEALSYTWATEKGDTTLSSSVYCQNASIQITKNCEDALRRLRKREGERILWVDAICINQRDDNERGHQVGLMRDIYSNATQVLIWLGVASDDVDEGSGLPVSAIFLEYLGPMAAEIRQLEQRMFSSEGYLDCPTSSPLYQKLVSQTYEGSLTSKHKPLSRGLLNIGSRSWWDRIWVVQEATVAKSAILICSEHTADYSDFYRLCRLVATDFSDRVVSVWSGLGRSIAHLDCVYRAKMSNNSYDRPLAIFRVLHRVRELKASDPRDKIFGILGLSDIFKTILPSPDYCKAPMEVFKEVTGAFLSRSKSLYILSSASTEEYASEHPSWVSDWSRPAISYFPDVDAELYNAARKSKSLYEISSDGKDLNVLGKEVDYVKKISLADLGTYKYGGTDLERLQGWQSSCILGNSLTKYPTKERVKEALWRTLCWNIDDRKRYPAPTETGYYFEEWYRILMSRKAIETKATEMSKLSTPFKHIVAHTSPLCITSNGFLASVPYTTKARDCIVVLAGGRVPFVIRRTADYYRLIGPCYVHGIMNGEAFPEKLSELESFSIR